MPNSVYINRSYSSTEVLLSVMTLNPSLVSNIYFQTKHPLCLLLLTNCGLTGWRLVKSSVISYAIIFNAMQ